MSRDVVFEIVAVQWWDSIGGDVKEACSLGLARRTRLPKFTTVGLLISEDSELLTLALSAYPPNNPDCPVTCHGLLAIPKGSIVKQEKLGAVCITGEMQADMTAWGAAIKAATCRNATTAPSPDADASL